MAKRIVGWALVAILCLWVVLAVLAMTNPTMNIPLVSPAVCSIKGKSWYGHADLQAGVAKAGCYDASAKSASPTIRTTTTTGH